MLTDDQKIESSIDSYTDEEKLLIKEISEYENHCLANKIDPFALFIRICEDDYYNEYYRSIESNLTKFSDLKLGRKPGSFILYKMHVLYKIEKYKKFSAHYQKNIHDRRLDGCNDGVEPLGKGDFEQIIKQMWGPVIAKGDRKPHSVYSRKIFQPKLDSILEEDEKNFTILQKPLIVLPVVGTKLLQATVIECIPTPRQNVTKSKCEIHFESAQTSELSIKEGPTVSKSKKKRNARKGKKPTEPAKEETDDFYAVLAEFGATAEDIEAANNGNNKPAARKKETCRQKRERLTEERKVRELKSAIQKGKCGKDYLLGDIMAAIKDKAVTAEEMKPLINNAFTENRLLFNPTEYKQLINDELLDRKIVHDVLITWISNGTLFYYDIIYSINESLLTKEEVKPLILKNIRTNNMQCQRTEIHQYVANQIITTDEVNAIITTDEVNTINFGSAENLLNAIESFRN